MSRTTNEDIEIWKQIYTQFEDEFGRQFLKDDNKKKKAHIDNSGEQTSNILIHEPQIKWSLVLFFDAMVQIATNISFTSKQQSCVDRRQFNHHNYLKKCIDDALGHDTTNSKSSKPIAKITPELDERCLVRPALTASSSISSTSSSSTTTTMKSVKRVTPELEERCVIAPPAPRTTTITQIPSHLSTQGTSKVRASTQALTSSFFSSMGMNSEKIKSTSSASIPVTLSNTFTESTTSDDSFDEEEVENNGQSSHSLQPPKKIRKKNEKKDER